MSYDTDTFIRQIEDALHDAEDAGESRQEIADTLEEMADVARNGYTTHPRNRGQWWMETHADEIDWDDGELLANGADE